jgi:2-dehydro-3-deoxygalactonokinase
MERRDAMVDHPSMRKQGPTFLSCDWGTSSFRLRLVEWETGRVGREVEEPCGVRSLSVVLGRDASAADRAQHFCNTLTQHVTNLCGDLESKDWPREIVVSGMASSSVGWKELPYAGVPFAIDGSQALVDTLRLDCPTGRPLRVLLVSGVASAQDMMRGEETEAIGLLSLPRFAHLADRGWLVLPGTHSKHIQLEQGQLIDFRTFMTGELFAVLSQHSLLRFTCDGAADAWDEEAFGEGVEAALAAGLSRSLFQVRSRGVLGGHPGVANRSFLSGLLIGEEWRQFHGSDGDAPVMLAAPKSLARFYIAAARRAGLREGLTTVPEDLWGHAVVEGHRQLARRFLVEEP